jgi:UDP-GlcNAc:undecaprenyl-phosphate GlcNAc-1-phosphate transferase
MAVTTLLTWVCALVLTPMVARWAVRHGWVDKPNRDRWHQQPTARLGGIAIYGGWLIGVLATAAWAGADVLGQQGWALVGATAIVFGLGLWDDMKTILPLPKFLGQIAAVSILLAAGVGVDFLAPGPLNWLVTGFWLLGVTNALNLLDNMNGLSSGVSAIAGTAMALYAATLYPQPTVVLLGFALAAACLGFLPYNARYRRPALAFMGDCGSQFLGFTLAALAVMGRWQAPGLLSLDMLLPILILAVPLFDTTLAICARRLEDRPISRGGRDHFSHRLVFLGLSDSQAVASLWLMTAAFSLLAWPLAYGSSHWLLAAVVPPLAVALYSLGVFLSTLRQAGQRVPRPHRMRAFQLGEVKPLMIAQDVLLTTAAWFAALMFHTGGHPSGPHLQGFLIALPVLLAMVVGTFLVGGVYRRSWPGVSSRDSLYLGALVLAAHGLAGILLLILPWSTMEAGVDLLGFSTLATYLLIKADRYAVPLWREVFAWWPLRRPALRVAIIGSGAAGLSVLQRLDAEGVTVVRIAGPDDIEGVLAQDQPDLVLLADDETQECQRRVVEACLSSGRSWLPAPV